MPRRPPSEPITIRTARVADIDALAGALDRSRNYIVNQAIEQYLDANAWQIQKIEEGLAAADAGEVDAVEDVLAEIEAKHGWSRRR